MPPVPGTRMDELVWKCTRARTISYSASKFQETFDLCFLGEGISSPKIFSKPEDHSNHGNRPFCSGHRTLENILEIFFSMSPSLTSPVSKQSFLLYVLHQYHIVSCIPMESKLFGKQQSQRFTEYIPCSRHNFKCVTSINFVLLWR